jgi:hypothetical protein
MPGWAVRLLDALYGSTMKTKFAKTKKLWRIGTLIYTLVETNTNDWSFIVLVLE